MLNANKAKWGSWTLLVGCTDQLGPAATHISQCLRVQHRPTCWRWRLSSPRFVCRLAGRVGIVQAQVRPRTWGHKFTAWTLTFTVTITLTLTFTITFTLTQTFSLLSTQTRISLQEARETIETYAAMSPCPYQHKNSHMNPASGFLTLILHPHPQPGPHPHPQPGLHPQARAAHAIIGDWSHAQRTSGSK